MPDQTFEARLANSLAAYAEAGVRPIDRYAVAEATIAAGPPRALHGSSRWLVPVLLGLLLVALVAGVVIVGSRLLPPELPSNDGFIVEPVGSMGVVRAGLTATLLADGGVLVAGGSDGFGQDAPGLFQATTASAEVYDPTTKAFTRVGAMSSGREDHAAVRLADGRVLITGGHDSGQDGVLDTAEIFDPATGTFAPTGRMVSARRRHTAVLLPDGRVAIIGGTDDIGSKRSPWPPSDITPSSVSPSVEFYDPATGTFAAGPPSDQPGRVGIGAVVLDDGLVFVSGGSGPEPAFIVDPTTGEATWVGRATVHDGQDGWMPDRTGRPALMGDRGAIVAAGSPIDSWVLTQLGQSRVFWQALVDVPGEPLLGPTVLADGRVLLAVAGQEGCDPVRAFIFDPTTAALEGLGAIDALRTCTSWDGSTLTALDDGSALIAGGNGAAGEAVAGAWLIRLESAP